MVHQLVKRISIRHKDSAGRLENNCIRSLQLKNIAHPRTSSTLYLGPYRHTGAQVLHRWMWYKVVAKGERNGIFNLDLVCFRLQQSPSGVGDDVAGS